MSIHDLIETDWPLLRSLLPSELDLEVSARKLGAHSRRRGVSHAADVVRLALAYSVCGMSLRQTAAWARLKGLGQLSDVALLNRLRKSATWLGYLVGWTLQQRTDLPSVQQAPFKLRLIDATCVSRPGSGGTDWRIHLGLSLPDLRIDHVELTDAHGGETLCRLPVQPGELIVGDRGYAHRQGLADVYEAGADFLVRINWHNLPLQHPDGSALSVIDEMRATRTTRELPVHIPHGQHAIPARLLILPLTQEVADKARKRIAKERSKKGRTVDARTLEAAGYLAVVTSMAAERLDTVTALSLYRARWQIELAFKRLKSLLDLDDLPAKDPDLARTWLNAKLLAALWLDELIETCLPGPEPFPPRPTIAPSRKTCRVGDCAAS